ncbi:transcription initiation factor TFIID subunit 1 isoform X2 [Jatropha curcas]|uniref:transcription initiation factor TFIID subunit 1 isoform X2 n=1 Tax=Jatropha curcas TaxID=180498 RepID=UPI0009D787E7|nr:transcription initiation factor TFIID subunit 1 isoform X2 [Jatropha curcas]
MGGYESGGASQDARDEDDDEEYEEVGGGNRLLGFMFGNVDNSGDLDVDYLDEDAKEHLGALADKLGPSLTDIDLSVKSPHASADAAEQDYDAKAEDAVDYEDIDEQYEGPEIQAASEEDFLLPKKEYFSSEVSLATLEQKTSVFDDENYDEEEETEREDVVVEKKLEVQGISLSNFLSDQQDVAVVLAGETSPRDGIQLDSLDAENLDDGLEDFEEEIADAMEGPPDDQGSTPLPILCIEDGMVILRFSEIFGIHEPLKKAEKRGHRYSINKERYKSMDVSDVVEEDEEAFLKGSSQVFQLHSYVNQYDVSVFSGDILESGKFGAKQGSIQDEKQKRSSCTSSEPMNKDLSINLASGWQSPLCSKFYPLDQQDWEDRILWDNSPVSNNSIASCELSGPDLGNSFIKEMEQASSPQSVHLELPMNPDEQAHNIFLHGSPVVVESFDSGDSSGQLDLSSSESRSHPQLLRLESQLEGEKYHDVGGRRENNAVEIVQCDAVRRFSKLTLQNKDMMEGSWLDEIIWEPNKDHMKPKLILDLQDEQMLFEVLDKNDSKHLQLHAGAMIVTRSLKPRVSPDLSGHGYNSGWQFNIANDKFYMNRKISQQLQSNSGKRIAYGTKVHHSAPAIKLQTMKLKLSNKDLANFHRPKALWYPHDNEVAVKEQKKLPTQGPMKIILKSLGGKGSKLHVDAEETVSSVKAKASKKLDFKPSEMVKIFYLGKELEDQKSLAAQNVQPNSLLHLVRTKIHLLPRAQRIPGENKSLRPPGAFKKKSDLSVKDGHIFLMEYCEERPLLLSNIGMGANLCTYYQKSSTGDQSGISLRNGNSSLGNVVVLEPTDKSPFLGDIKAGCSQSALVTNMYKAPIFPHKVASTDYLLVRSAKGKLSIRRIDQIAVVGQQEPLMEVFSPGSKNLQSYITNRLLLHVYREFRAAEKRGIVPWIRADELSTQFPNLSETMLRKKMKECAVLRRDANGHLFWSKKRDFIIPSEEDLKKLVLPENVCAYESMQAGLYRLKHLGITRLTNPTNVSTAMSQLPDEAIALAAASHIERELQITPWSLSSNFVACTNQDRENIERLEITGVGDPSGRGLGFSYVRAATKATVSNAMVKKKAAAGRGGSTVTGTDADLRRLSMEAAREVLLKFNVPEEQIAKQTRWHRIATIRKLSSEQAASGVKVDPTTISKYARGQRMSFLQLQQQTREKCQEIWDRQVQSLSAVDGDENESDSEANSDLDSFAGDLENLLDAEECEGDESNYESKHDKADGMKGLKMRGRASQAQAEEEIEDEAAEAAELCRLLMDDDEAEQKKKKKTKIPGVGAGLAPRSKPNFVANAERIKKTNKVHPNDSCLPKESSIRDSKEVETLFAKRKMSEKLKAIKKNGTSDSTISTIKTKVKISGEGPKTFKEKKPSRETFVCGACGQLGHMRTNKNCPKYGEESEAQVETADLEKVSGKSNSLDPSSKSMQKLQKKKSMPKGTVKVQPSESEKSSLKAKPLPVKFKCGSTEKLSDKPADGATKSSDWPVTSDARPDSSDVETGSKPIAKVSKIKISNKAKTEDVQVELHKPSIVIRPPMDTDRSQIESHKPSIVIRPPSNTERDHVESHKPSIVIRPPAVKDREQAHKKIVIKQPKEIVDLDQVSQDGSTGFEFRKIKRIAELSGIENRRKSQILHFPGESAKRKSREEGRWWEEEEKRRNTERLREGRARRIYGEETRGVEEQGLAELRRYEEAVRREREEEEQQKAKKKKKKKKKPEISDDYLDDYRASRRMPERDRGAKRRPVVELGRFGAEYTPATKRRRGGEVGLANILEHIVDTLKDKLDISYLFLKPVSKKEAPDYLDIIKHPMDLSTIRDKVRKMEYKHREDFRHDVWQITYNAHLYNDRRNPGIPPLADQLLELCDYLLKEQSHSLSEAEAGIESREN